MGVSRVPIAIAIHLLALPAICLAGQASVALHRKSNQLDAVASRSAKNVAVSSLARSSSEASYELRLMCDDGLVWPKHRPGRLRFETGLVSRCFSPAVL